jgi:hypothetical protein
LDAVQAALERLCALPKTVEKQTGFVVDEPPSRKPYSKASFSDMRKARSPERCAAQKGYLPKLTKARFF